MRGSQSFAVAHGLVASALVLFCVAAPARAQSWGQLSPKDRRKAQEKYEIYRNMPQTRQQEIQRSYREWQSMKPAERAQIRKNYKAYRSLTPQQRRAVGELYQEQQGGR